MKKIILSCSLILVIFNLVYGQWSTNPAANSAMAITSGEEAIPKVSTSVNGITYISWFSNESGNYNVRLQKLDLFGNKMWDEAGILISDNSAMTWLTDWDMTVDQEDCAILCYLSLAACRSLPHKYHIYHYLREFSLL